MILIAMSLFASLCALALSIVDMYQESNVSQTVKRLIGASCFLVALIQMILIILHCTFNKKKSERIEWPPEKYQIQVDDANKPSDDGSIMSPTKEPISEFVAIQGSATDSGQHIE